MATIAFARVGNIPKVTVNGKVDYLALPVSISVDADDNALVFQDARGFTQVVASGDTLSGISPANSTATAIATTLATDIFFLTSGSGSLPANVAYTDNANNFSVREVFSAGLRTIDTIQLGGAGAGNAAIGFSGSTVQMYKADFSALTTLVASVFAAQGSLAEFVAHRRDNNNPAFSIASTAGEVTVYSHAIGATAFQITTAGDIILNTTGKGIILKSPDGTSYKLTVANGGTAVFTAI